MPAPNSLDTCDMLRTLWLRSSKHTNYKYKAIHIMTRSFFSFPCTAQVFPEDLANLCHSVMCCTCDCHLMKSEFITGFALDDEELASWYSHVQIRWMLAVEWNQLWCVKFCSRCMSFIYRLCARCFSVVFCLWGFVVVFQKSWKLCGLIHHSFKLQIWLIDCKLSWLITFDHLSSIK